MLNRTPYPDKRPNGAYVNGTNGSSYTAAEAAEDEISLREIIEILMKGRWMILGAFFVVLSAVAAYTFLKAPEYEANSMLYVNSQDSSPQLGDLLGVDMMTNRNILNEIEILKSRAIAQRVAEELLIIQNVPGTDQLLTVLEQDDEESAPLTPLRVAQRLRENYITVRPVSDEVDLLQVQVTSTIPDEAALIANLFAEEFVEYNQETSRESATASRQFLDDQASRFDSTLAAAEDRLMEYSEAQGIVDPLQEAEQLLEQYTKLQSMQYEVRFALSSAEAELAALEQELERVKPGIARAIASNDNQLIQGLLERITQLQLEIEERKAKNPNLTEENDTEIAQRRQQIRELQRQIDAATERITADILGGTTSSGQSGSAETVVELVNDLQQQIMRKQIEISAAEARLEVLNQSLQTYQNELDEIPNKTITLSRLDRTVQTGEQLYTTLFEKLQEARIAEQSELGYIKVIDRAFPPEEPVRPKIPLNLALGAILGLALGIGLAFLRNAVDNKVRKPEDLRKHGYSVIGVVPDMERVIKSDFDGRERVTIDGHSYSTSLITLLNPLSPVAESYRRLRTNIQFSMPDRSVQTIMVTSAEPGEGKTVTSMNMAVAMSQSGRKTVYIDADLRRARGHRMMGVAREPGLVELLFEAVPTSMDRFATDIDDLYVIPTGSSVPNPAEVLGSKKMRDFINRLRQEFDVIVIDTPPVLAVTDAVLMAAQCDAALLVCAANRTNWHAVERATESLHDVDAKLLGVILNRFDPKSAYGAYGYGYGYGYGYYDYYGDKDADKAEAVA